MSLFKRFNVNPESKDAFIEQGLVNSNVHPVLASSWQRSTNHNIDPNIIAAPIALEESRSEFDQTLLRIAQPFYRYFSNLLDVDEGVLILSNGNGVLLHMEASSSFTQVKKFAEKHNLLVNADWSEKKVGTNAIGTAIVEKISVSISGYEHYSNAWHPYSCAASPICDLNTGEVIGAVNVSSFYDKLQVQSFGWVTVLAKLIEKEIAVYQIAQTDKMNKNSKIFVGPGLQSSYHKNNSAIVGTSPAFLDVLDDAKKAAQSPLNVLITGETGTGKEVVAKHIHNSSDRQKGSFVAVNCAAIPKELVASELFGYTSGAFTGASRRGRKGRFEQAEGGTLFLDEIGDAPYKVQLSLLRVLEEKKVYPLGAEEGIEIDVRVIGATSRDLKRLMANDLFRKDLYYRLSGVILLMPPLRQRDQDIISLAEYFLEQYNAITSRRLILSQQLKEIILGYPWPGNIRELKNAVERMAAMSDTEVITEELFNRYVQHNMVLKSDLDDPPKKELISVLKRAKGNVTLAAKLMGVNRTTIYRRMEKYGVTRKSVTSKLA